MVERDRDVTEVPPCGINGSGEEGSPEAARESREVSARVPVEKSERPIVATTRREIVGLGLAVRRIGSPGRRGRSLETRVGE